MAELRGSVFQPVALLGRTATLVFPAAPSQLFQPAALTFPTGLEWPCLAELKVAFARRPLTRGYPVRMGDFVYKVTRRSGKTTTTHTYRFSYLIVHLPFGRVPDLLIRREGVFDKIAGAFGFDDIDFESSEFSRKFHIKSPDKRFAYDVCHPRMMEYLLQTSPPAIDIENGRCCISDGSRRWEPPQFKATLSWVRTFFDHWPEHVTAEL